MFQEGADGSVTVIMMSGGGSDFLRVSQKAVLAALVHLHFPIMDGRVPLTPPSTSSSPQINVTA